MGLLWYAATKVVNRDRSTSTNLPYRFQEPQWL
jgi:hypothetical protein